MFFILTKLGVMERLIDDLDGVLLDINASHHFILVDIDSGDNVFILNGSFTKLTLCMKVIMAR